MQALSGNKECFLLRHYHFTIIKEGTMRFDASVPLFLNVGSNDMLKRVRAAVDVC